MTWAFSLFKGRHSSKTRPLTSSLHHLQVQKNPPKQVFLSEHGAWRHVFERAALIGPHAFQDFAQFHDDAPLTCYTTLLPTCL
ncbi:hypothetical protein CIG53_22650 [Enterobacter asburiae]|nr:hypothetical protein CIG53_22650 [Enterobacter asburiae]QBB05581.1 hypothetical protein EVV94_11620 [Enterobacter cloacae]